MMLHDLILGYFDRHFIMYTYTQIYCKAFMKSTESYFWFNNFYNNIMFVNCVFLKKIKIYF